MAEAEQPSITFSSLFSPEEILCHTDLKERNEVLMAVLRRLAYNRGIGNVDHAYEAVVAREEESSTVLAPGIAVPHARLEAIEELVVGVATSQEGIQYGAGDEAQTVHLLILILAPKTAPGAYLQALSALAATCQDAETARRVAELPTAEEVWRFFERGSLVLPDHVRASDVMDPVTVSLQENDTLEMAIDLFVRERRNDLPVVDKDGDLIGVVTSHELLRVCLPDYILWMEDLSPILNFEPFAEILRKESNTWLAEIMTSEYATVSEASPAIQVAKEITRRNATHAYVIRGRKLVGVVSLEGFLNKVMRE